MERTSDQRQDGEARREAPLDRTKTGLIDEFRWPHDPCACARYEGGVVERDGAYHQGTVWPFLLGLFVTAWMKAFGQSAVARNKAHSFLVGLEAHLQEACRGQVSEMFNAQAPHLPRGCFFAQA